MGALENSLRTTFSERVATAPAVDDAAGRAIGAARRSRRRRMLLGALGAVLGVFLVAGGIAVIQPVGGWGGGPSIAMPTDGDLRLPTDALAGNQILRARGERISLETLPPAVAAYRVPDGWLVVTYTTGSRWHKLWLVTPDPNIIFLNSAESIAVSADRHRVAWGGGGSAVVATVEGQRLVSRQQTMGTGTLRPVGFVGAGVLMAGPAGKDGSAAWDIWYPERGQFRPTAGHGPTAVYGVSRDGRTLYGAYDRSTCLSEINPDGMLPRRQTCEVRVGPGYQVWESPGGNRLLVSGEGLLLVYDLNTMWSDGQAIAGWSVRAASAAWLDNNLIVAGGTGSITRLRVDHPYRQEESVYLSGSDGQRPIIVVPDLDD